MIHRRSLLAGSLGVPLLTACGGGDEEPPATIEGVSDDGFYGTFIEEGMPLPDVELIDQNGQPYNIRTGWKTKAIALFFGYLNCPDVCPGIMADMATAKRRLPEELVDDITIIVVTTDPARDTPEALKEYLARVDDSFVGLSGSLDDIKPAAMSLGIDISAGKELPSGGYEVDHGTYVLGFGEDRTLQVVWNQVPVSGMKDDYQRLIG